MSAPTAIVRWQSPHDASRCGFEIAGFALGVHRLEVELDRTMSSVGRSRPAFVFTSLGTAAADSVATSIACAADFSSVARMCVAINEATFVAADPARLRDPKVGIVLDQVDADTPLSVLSHDLVEAVRFTREFVARATVDARSAYVLSAMLSLAHDLGLATLAMVGEGDAPSEFEFDYVVSANAAASLSR